MRFFPRQRRRPPAIIIVALIDILIVLLIFLLVTTTFKQQPALKLALPESSQAQKAGANENAPLVISIDPKGDLRFGPQARAVTLEGFKSELIVALQKKPELGLAINADKTAPIGVMVKIMDVTKEVGVKSVKLITK